MTSFEYLDILRKKTMEKKTIKEIKASERKDKQGKQDKWVAKLSSIVEQTTRKIVEKCSKT